MASVSVSVLLHCFTFYLLPSLFFFFSFKKHFVIILYVKFDIQKFFTYSIKERQREEQKLVLHERTFQDKPFACMYLCLLLVCYLRLY